MPGTEDPIADKLQILMAAYKIALNDIANFIDRGKKIEKIRKAKTRVPY